MRRLPILAGLLSAAALCAGGAGAATPAAAPDGHALFRVRCGMCHGASGMGTNLLARRTKPAELAKRTDLQADFVVQAARTGIGNMPPITRGDVSDTELSAIAHWLATPPDQRK